jgi:hypothetical protein
MKKHTTIIIAAVCLSCMFIFTQCTNKATSDESQVATAQSNFGGYESQENWGEHLVTIAGCNDCHTPKKMTDHGPDIDSSLLLSGHPAGMPAPEVDRKDLESKGIAATNTLTAWVGPWGVSYSANLTSDPTGIGGWTEQNFITALREGKYKGIASGRPLMPPMPWQMIGKMTDDELKAVFAFLKSTKPVSNVVPELQPPLTAMAH